MKEFTISDFPHTAPEGYSYEFKEFNNRLVAIWLYHFYPFSYTTKSVKSIWGFYSPKKREYYSPINSTKCGNKVNIKDTNPYTAMKLNITPLESCFV